MSNQPREPSALAHYLQALLDLHRLELQGQADSELADQIRDQGEPFWTRMSEQERQLCRIVSAQLARHADAITL